MPEGGHSSPSEIRNPQGERIATTFVPGDPTRRELIVIGHGVTSDKERPWSEALSAGLAAEGIASLRIAFSGNGESEGRFVDSTITKEVGDLGAVLDAVGERPVAYVGHSMGGAVGLLRAVQDPRLVALVSLAPVVHTAEFVTRMFGDLVAGQPILGKPHCPFGEALRDDLMTIGTTVDAAAEVRVPWLVVHGEADEVVPAQQSIDLHERSPERSELVLLDGVDHSFTGAGLSRLVEAVVPWLVRALG